MFKDKATGASAFDAGGSPLYSVITESDLFDATNNCIQDGDACTGGSSPADAMDDLDAADGWVIGLAGGEKVISNAVTLNRVTFFNTNQPGAAAAAGTCASDLGIARQYQVNFDDATAVDDRNEDSETDAGDRAQSQPGGGYLPSPVPVVVEIDGQIHEAVISGVRVDEPPGSQIGSRFRRFWYKEFDG